MSRCELEKQVTSRGRLICLLVLLAYLSCSDLIGSPGQVIFTCRVEEQKIRRSMLACLSRHNCCLTVAVVGPPSLM